MSKIKMKLKISHTISEPPNLQEVQRRLADFEDDVLPYLPSKEAILARAKQRQLKKKALGGTFLSLLAVLCGVYWYNPAYEHYQVKTLKGQQELFYLSDGTTIHLNTDTQIEVIEGLRSRVLVLQQGEASFHVAHSSSPILKRFERQFKVVAGDMQVIDIGTVFNVLKHNQTDATVAVEQGEVAVTTKGPNQNMIHLVQGQSLSNQKQQLSRVHQVDLYTVKAWQSGDIVFNQVPLLDAIKSFQRYTDFDVEIQNPALQTIRITGQFKAQNYQKFMQVLPIVVELNVEKLSDKKWKIK